MATPETDACPRCGSSDLILESRDPVMPETGPPPRTAYGTWGICQACRHEWPEEPDEKGGERDG